MLNYLGQGAYLLAHDMKLPNAGLFFATIDHGFLPIAVVIATLAAVIASQALISGAFALSSQAVALGLFPRLKVIHTHHEHSGQTYVPIVNFMIFCGCMILAWTFKSSSALAGAYGFALSCVMLVTTMVMMLVASRYWHWPATKVFLIFGSFSVVDVMFVGAKSSYFLDGGYIPTIVGGIIFLVMWAWKWGRKATFAAYADAPTLTMSELIEIKEKSSVSLKKNVIFMVQKQITDASDHVPALVQMYLNRYHYPPEHIFLVQVIHRKVPHVYGPRHESEVFYKSNDRGSIVMVRVFFGFMEEPNVEKVLEELSQHHEIDLPRDPHRWLVHVSHEYLIAPKSMGIVERFKLKLFMFLRQISQPAYYHYGLGRDVNLSMDILPVFVPPEALWDKLLRRKKS
jgi:KUP system potassium uptake protein